MKDFQPGRDTGSAGSAGADIDFEAEHRPDVSRRASNAAIRRYIQRQAISGASLEATHEAAAKGVASPTSSLPFADQIQASFGPSHDVSKINAHVGGDSASAMGASAYASGDHVVFDHSPDLHTAAHEAAHVVQQAQGVNLYGGVGEAGDSYERHADAVADRVVAGQSAADLLGPSGGSAGQGVVQKKPIARGLPDAASGSEADAKIVAGGASHDAILEAIETATKRIHSARHTIIAQRQANIDERGLEPQLHAFDEQYSIAAMEIDRIYKEVSAPAIKDLSFGELLNNDVVRLGDAVFLFFEEYGRAKQFARAHNRDMLRERHDQDTLASLNAIYANIGSSKYTSVQHPDEQNAKQPVHDKESKSFFANVTALGENGALIERMVGKATDEDLAPYLARSKAHAMEVEKLLPVMSKKELHSEVIGKALYGIHKLKLSLQTRKSLEASTTFLVGTLERIQPSLEAAIQ